MALGVFTASNALPAADLNSAFKPPYCRVYNSAAISLATSGTAQALTFDTETYDNLAMHSTSVNTDRITVPTGGGGIYLVGARCRFTANATGYRRLELKINGTGTFAEVTIPSVSTNADCTLEVTGVYTVAAGDYFQVFATQSSGGALNTVPAVPYGTEFWAIWQAVA